MTAQVIWILSTLPSAASALQSSISALERDIAALESQSSGLEPWLGRFTLLVAIGVALEIFVVIHDYRKEVTEWRVSELIPERPSLIKLGIEIASIILVIVGVMGEFGVGLKISAMNGQLRAKGAELRGKSDQLLALVTQEAGDAEASAEGAAEAARTSRLEADAATKLAGKAEGKAEKVGEKADEISARLDTASQQLAKIEQRVRVQGPRWQWLEDNKSEFIESLKPFAGSITTVKCGPIASPEQIRVEVDLSNFIGKEGAGWKTTNIFWPQCSTYGFSGFLLIWSESATTEVNNSATGLMSALRGLAFPRFGYRVGKSVIGVFGTDSPFAKALSDPTTIFVVVGPNSMEDLYELEHPKNANKPKIK
jgi:hypothetical protein